MSLTHPLHIHLEFNSTFEMIDVAQTVSDQVCRELRLDDDSCHWVGMAVREAVANAVEHGNRLDAAKTVFLTFDGTRHATPELSVAVRDQGAGFDPDTVADPLAPENLLKGRGRGIFLIRSFMDAVVIERSPLGGMEMRMTKRAQTAPASTPDSAA